MNMVFVSLAGFKFFVVFSEYSAIVTLIGLAVLVSKFSDGIGSIE